VQPEGPLFFRLKPADQGSGSNEAEHFHLRQN
jgi:hypothetical protein